MWEQFCLWWKNVFGRGYFSVPVGVYMYKSKSLFSHNVNFSNIFLANKWPLSFNCFPPETSFSVNIWFYHGHTGGTKALYKSRLE